MITRKTLIVANWKMHMNVGESSRLLANYHRYIGGYRDIEVVIAPSMLALQPLSQHLDRRRFRLVAQNAHPKDEGGYTGETSFAMLNDLVHYVIIGHSERRIYFEESHKFIRDKVASAIRNNISPILCIGETAHERANNETKHVLHDQLVSGLSHLTPKDVKKVVIAYEPVWAISNFGGKTAKPADMQKAFDYIKGQVAHLYGNKTAEKIRILYGGSVDDNNVVSYLNIDGCDGALVGSASLNYHKFTGIVDAAYKNNRKNED